MSKQISIVILLLLSAFAGIATVDNNSTWKKAVACYQQKQYDSAVIGFEQIAATKPENPEVYYNLGNIYYKLNRIAPAVLNYERALKLNPDYKDAKDNLMLAQNRIPNHLAKAEDIFFITWWQTFTHASHATALAITTLIIFLLILLVSIQRRFAHAGSKLPVQVNGVLGFTFLCFFVFTFISANNSYKHNTAVVMENDAPLMNNEQKGKPLTLVPEGTTIKILNEKGLWVEVSLPDGRTGWLQQNLLGVI